MKKENMRYAGIGLIIMGIVIKERIMLAGAISLVGLVLLGVSFRQSKEEKESTE